MSAILQISLLLIVAGLIGFFTAWFYWRNKYRKMKASYMDELEKQRNVIAEKQKVTDHHKERVLKLERELATLQEKFHVNSSVPEEIYRAIVKNVGEGISVSDEEGNFVIFNPELEKITGYSQSEANANNEELFLTGLYPDPELRARVNEHIHQVPGNNGHTNIKTIITRKNQEKVPVLATSTKVALDGKEFYLTAYRDMSEKPTPEA